MSLRLGLFRRRECVLPTLRGWVVIFLAVGMLAMGALYGIHPFLAKHDPKPGGILVVEGWGSEEVMQEVIDEFKRSRCERIYVTGGPIEDSSPLAEYKTLAEYGAVVLLRLGCDAKVVQAVPTPKVVKDRTYASAAALKKWLKEHNAPAKTINVYSMGAHSRRSRMLFQIAFGDDVEVGVIASPDRDFDPRRWWMSSSGFRSVTAEAIAYVYALLFFRPPEE
jgi:hypothetical protein